MSQSSPPFELELTAMAHGGAALGRDSNNRVVFVPGGIPGETVRVELISSKSKFGKGRLVEVLTPSPDRVPLKGPVAGPFGGLSYQHIRYAAQLEFKRSVIADQFKRVGGLEIEVPPVIASPAEWGYAYDVTLSPTKTDGFGFWSAESRQVIPAEASPVLVDPLNQLLDDFEFELPDLRKITLRAGTDDGLLVALEVTDVEPPEIEVDFPVDVAIVLPDGTAASLIGYNALMREIHGRPFRISAGVEAHSNISAMPGLIDSLVGWVKEIGPESILELYSGAGCLTRFLAEAADVVFAIERNDDAITDATENLDATENVYLYAGWVEEILPGLDLNPDCVVADPPSEGMSDDALKSLCQLRAPHLMLSYDDVATAARDAKSLHKNGYRLARLQPIDLRPQTFHTHLLMHWTL